ncbi:23487_t:CDS:2 [Cetraspora pellucida]|uniref:23487_t:CDS:1 n=1 Tax=Cetraspora pellucida TaxID=1433469 RepID=A0A9N9EBX1_9GLOM|nr:23487_t:CDS:2 [Cetraspora pellucida]
MLNDKTNNEVKYYKIYVKECEETYTKPYSYSKAGGSMGYLTYHLSDKYNITVNNYREHLDSSQEITLIYGSLSENSEQTLENLSDNNTSVSSSDKVNIPLARTKSVTELNNTNTIKDLSSAKCKKLLEKMHATIYLSLDELWSISDEVELKASMLDPRMLKLLPFTTVDKHKNTEAQIHTELSILDTQFKQNNNNTETCITTEEEEYNLLNAELWGLLSIFVPQTITEDELTRYLKEQIAYKSQDLLI